MTRRARGRGAWRSGARAACVLVFALGLFVVTSCNGRFTFQSGGAGEAGEGGDGADGSGGKFPGFGGFFHGGGSSGSFGTGRGGGTGSSGGSPANNECANKRCTDHGLTCTQQNSDYCVECARDSDCVDEPRRVCSSANSVKNRCVECDDEGDCGTGETCAEGTHTCVPACRENSQCTSGMMECNGRTGYCVACWDNPDCEDSKLGDCPDDYSRCVECDAHDDCGPEDAGEWCDPVLFKCVACRTSYDCNLDGDDDQVCHPISHTCVN